MWRRWVDVAVARPELLADHAGAWAQFLAAEWTPTWRAQRRQAAVVALALLSGTLGLGLAGVALMLAAVAPLDATAHVTHPLLPWALWLVPGVPLLLSLACAGAAVKAARQQRNQGTWARVTRQWAADRALWQEAGAE